MTLEVRARCHPSCLACGEELRAKMMGDESHISPMSAELIDQEMEKMKTSLRHVGTWRNRFVPGISRLPPELLCRIFEIYVDRWPLNAKRPYGWTRITRVCTLWRKIALGCPRLWTRVVMSSDPMDPMAEILRRSKTCPLSVWIRPKDIYVPIPNQEQCFKHMYRIQELHVYEHLTEELFSISSAPVLQSLSIGYLSAHSQDLVFPNSFFGGHTPCLRRLTLSNCWVNADSPMLSNLRYLHLREHHLEPPRLSSFVAILQASPLLERLTLDLYNLFQVQTLDEWPQEGNSTANLANLTYLELNTDSLDAGIHLLDHVSFRPNTRLRLDLWPKDSSHLERLASLIAERYNVTEQEYTVVQVLSREHIPRTNAAKRGIYLVAWTQKSDSVSRLKPLEGWDESSAQLYFRLNEQNADSLSRCGIILKCLCMAISLPSLQVLCLHNITHLNVNSWLEIFREARELHTIDCEDRFPIDLLSALSGDAAISQPFNGYPENIFLPALHTIVLRNISFAEHNHAGALGAMLTKRRECNAEIKHLWLIDCTGVSKTDRRLLARTGVDLKYMSSSPTDTDDETNTTDEGDDGRDGDKFLADP